MSETHETQPEPSQSEDLFVDFANTLEFDRGEPVEHLPDVDALVAWLRERGLLSERGATAELSRLRRDPAEADRRLERFRYLRKVLQEVARRTSRGVRPAQAHLREVNHILRHGLHYHQLHVEPDGAHYAVTQVGDPLDQARATIANSLAHYLADHPAGRLRICANRGCRWVFVDSSPTGQRRWCDMRTCGNQAKVARHRARQRASATRPSGTAADGPGASPPPPEEAAPGLPHGGPSV